MLKRNKVLMSLVLTLGISLVGSSVYAKLNINIKRLAGADRYETCNKIVTEGWKNADTVIIVNSQMFADAITAAPLSKKYNAPILLADKYSLTKETANKLQSLGAKNVYIIGGTGVISDELKNNIEKMNIAVKRIAGQDRYETSVKMAETLGNSENAFIVDGDSWEDALSIAPVAAKLQAPILLVNRDYVPDSVSNFEKKERHANYIIGDFDFVANQNITSKLNGTVKSISGSDKLETNLAVINFFKDKLNLNNVFLASSSTFADALSGSALAGMNGNPIVLSSNNNLQAIKSFIDNNQSNIGNLYVLGGNSVITDNQVDLLKTTEKDKMQDFKNDCKEYEYKILSKNPDNFIDKNMRFRGKVMQILENGNDTFMLVQVSYDNYGFYKDTIAVFYNGKTDVYKDDLIDIWGTGSGSYNYTSVAGYKLSVPGIQAKYIEK